MLQAAPIRLKPLRSKKFKRLHRLSVAFGAFLVIVSGSYLFFSRMNVYPGNAAQMLMCLRICSSGPCATPVCANPPNVTTGSVSNITTTSADAAGTVTSDGGDSISSRGFVVATTTSPTTSDSVFTDTATGTGAFTVALTGLSSNTSYYVRAYATNSVDIAYGSSVNFATLAPQQGGQTQGPTGGGGAPLGTSTPPHKPKPALSQLLVPGHPVQDGGFVELSGFRNFGDSFDIPRGLTKARLRFNRPTFRGTTNIKNASILITLASEVQYATTKASEKGDWEWTVTTPLEDGEHTISIQTMTTEDPSLTTTVTYTFIVDTAAKEEPPAESEVAGPAPQEPSGSGAGSGGGAPVFEPAPIVPGESHEYVINVEILSEPEDISRTGSVDIKTEVVSFNPGVTEPVTIRYKLYDESGELVFEESKVISVTDRVVDYSRAVSSVPLKPGRYVADVTLTYRSKSVGSTRIFEVKSYHVIETPLVSLSADDVRVTLERTIYALSIMLLLSLLLLYREHRNLKDNPYRISDEDLLNSGMMH